jgi:hypothetical protein
LAVVAAASAPASMPRSPASSAPMRGSSAGALRIVAPAARASAVR